jgi:hypothetical protein
VPDARRVMEKVEQVVAIWTQDISRRSSKDALLRAA